MNALIAWINRELWGPVWPNLAASGLCTGLVWSRARIHLRRQAEHHAEALATTHTMLQRLHEHLGVDMPQEDQT